ncbi:PREDICTED: cuticle protein 16.5-like [Rhagoletis zephyria]|uniref:cuticle protein 16.5-like n=1 Tax=Rhagoletis zephyria TaxID=28612 RepID=UPI000811A656|nr:PREDICTED: cuticle protein 16.5-like [Rhagoletis zephyria]
MFKYAIVIFAIVACITAKPVILHAPQLAAAPVALAAAAPVITATSSQVIARQYNGIAAAPLLAAPAPIARLATPLVAPLPAPSIHYAAPAAAAAIFL